MRRMMGLSAVALFSATAALAADDGLPVRIAGTIQQVTPANFTVKMMDGKIYTVTLGPQSRVVADIPIQPDQIKVGDYIAADAKKGEDGVWRAFVGHTQQMPFGGAQPGAPGRMRPQANNPNQARLLSVVDSITPNQGGVLVRAKIDGGSMAEVYVPFGITLYNAELDGPALLKPGMAVDVPYDKAPNGDLIGRFITVEKDGHKPVDD